MLKRGFKLQLSFNVTERTKERILKSISNVYLKKVFLVCIENINAINNSKKDKIIFLNFIKDNEIKLLNKEARGKDYPTDCLSFPYEPDDFIESYGDIFIAFPYIEKQAKGNCVTLKYEITKMFVHSFLHLFGFDHEKDSDFIKMEEMERKIMDIFK